MLIDTESFSVGDRVRVVEPIIVYHHPDHRSQEFNLQGQEGEVVQIVKEYQGRPVSANFPYLVKFGAKFKVHLQSFELEKA